MQCKCGTIVLNFIQGEAEANDSDSGTAIDTDNNLVAYANGGDTALITEH